MKKIILLTTILIFSLQVLQSQIEITSPSDNKSYCLDNDLSINFTVVDANAVNITLFDKDDFPLQIIAQGYPAEIVPLEWTIPDNVPYGQYKIRIENAENASDYDETDYFKFTDQPVIVDVPISVRFCDGKDLKLYANTQGYDLTYQWLKEGAPIATTTDSTLTIPLAGLNDQGYYSVLVKNACDEVLSQEIEVKLFEVPLQITKQPESATNCLGNQQRFSVEATGDGVKYQWAFNGVFIKGATAPELVLSNLVKQNEGYYKVVISDTCGIFIESNQVSLNIEGSVSLTKDIDGVNHACTGESYSLYVETEGTELAYQWYRNELVIADETDSVLTFLNIDRFDEGIYYCKIEDLCGNEVKSNESTLNVHDFFTIISNPSDVEVFEGGYVQLEVAVNNEENIKSYQWIKDGENLKGKNNPVLELKGVALNDAGEYYCLVEGFCNTETTEKATVTINKTSEDGPVITVDEEIIDLGRVPFGKQKSETLLSFMTNVGNETLEVSSFTLTGDQEIEYLGENSFELAPGETQDLTFQVVAGESTKDYQAGILIESNALNEIVLLVQASSFLNIPEHDESEIDFGHVQNEPHSLKQEFGLINNTDFSINIFDALIIGEDKDFFEFDESFGSPFVIQKNSTKQIPINFIFSDDYREYNAELAYLPEYMSDSIKIPIKATSVPLSVNEIDEVESLRVFPNPTKDQSTLEINLKKYTNISIKLMTLNGRLVEVLHDGTMQQGMNTLNINVGNLSSGVYNVIIENDGKIATKQIVVTK